MQLARIVVLGVLATVMGCGGSSSPTGSGGGSNPPPPPPNGVSVTIADFSFTPKNVTIKAGQKVQWYNSGPSAHNVTADDDSWSSGNMAPPSGGGGYYGGGETQGSTFTHTFDTPGTYTYHCANHPPSGYPNFTGTITVTAP